MVTCGITHLTGVSCLLLGYYRKIPASLVCCFNWTRTRSMWIKVDQKLKPKRQWTMKKIWPGSWFNRNRTIYLINFFKIIVCSEQKPKRRFLNLQTPIMEFSRQSRRRQGLNKEEDNCQTWKQFDDNSGRHSFNWKTFLYSTLLCSSITYFTLFSMT